jgi:hypothetical protein
VTAEDGTRHVAQIFGEERHDGTWIGWIAFAPEGGKSSSMTQMRRTPEETSQPDRKALTYWATGLEPVYVEGAFNRARLRAD